MGKWVWSERAQHFYWSKWLGVDSAGQACDLPQYYWSEEWQEEGKSIVHFWMKTGIDGFVVDAVNSCMERRTLPGPWKFQRVQDKIQIAIHLLQAVY